MVEKLFNDLCRIISAFLLLMFTLGGCASVSHDSFLKNDPLTAPLTEAYIPKESSPSEPFRIFNANFDSTWKATLATISDNRGHLTFKSKQSGLITFNVRRIRNTRYVTLFLKKVKSQPKTVIYFRVWDEVASGDMGVARSFLGEVENKL